MASSVVQSGDYLLELDTGFDVNSFRLGDPLKGVLGNLDYTLGPNTGYAAITPYTTNINIRRGRRRPLDQFSAGTMTFTLDDLLAGGILSPYDESSPYYDPTNEQAGLAPMRKIRLSREGEYIFTGVVVNYDYQFNLANNNKVFVTCVDAFYLLSQTVLPETAVTEELSSDRLTTILDLPAVNFPLATRNISPGTQTLGGTVDFTIPNGTNTLQYIGNIQAAEQGRIFIDRNGDLVSQPRIGNSLSGPVISFADDNPAAPRYLSLSTVFDSSNVVNYAAVQIAGAAAPEIAEDLASQATYFIQAQNFNDSLLYSDSAALELAEYLLDGSPAPRFTSLTTNFALLTDAQRDLAATVDIGQTIQVQKTLIGTPSSLTEELSVEGIEHAISVNNGHTVTYYTAPTNLIYYLILGDPVFGRLSLNNVLG